MLSTDEYIHFEDLRQLLDISSPEVFKLYLKELYKDLSDRAESNKKLGISKITFWEYIKIHVFIAEKLFIALDRDNDGFLNLKEFTEGLYRLYVGTFEETVECIFNILDFDKDGKILKGDIKILVSYLPLKEKEVNYGDTHKIGYKYQMESLDEIDDIIQCTFGNEAYLTQYDFIRNTINKKSDIFLQIICFLYLNKPFDENNIQAYQKMHRKSFTELDISKSISDSNSRSSANDLDSPSKGGVRMPSPSRKTLFQPVETFLQINLECNSSDSEDIDIADEKNSPSKGSSNNSFKVVANQEKSFLQLVRMDNTKVLKSKDELKEVNDVSEVIKNSTGVLDSPTAFFKRKEPTNVIEFSLDNNLIKTNSQEDVSPKNSFKRSLSKKNSLKAKAELIYENWVYKAVDHFKLKQYYLVIVGKDIYYYKNESKEELLGMHNLSGAFVRENNEKKIEGVKYFSFSIIFSKKTRTYFTTEKYETELWVESLKKAIGYQSFFDYYEIISDLGEGKFGMVKLGLHKKTGEKVAIKVIKKDSMNISDMELVRSEIDIMKLCKHPNVVTLLDHFENSDYIFIIMEYLNGGDFGDFIHKRGFRFDECEAANLIYQVAAGIRYLHQFGIVHRDLKPENIMLTQKGNRLIVKIMDFGLSKIMGPLEKACDGFGTLSFVAPEVLVRQPYNKMIDIWSIGVILYYMLSGILPFDDESDNEEIIAKRTVFVELQFPAKNFKQRSKEVLDLITKCLIKDPNKRIQIDDLLNHCWFKNYIQS